MQIFIIANLEVDLVYNKKDDSLSKMDPLSRTLEKRVIKKLLKADFCIVQESAFLNSIDTYNCCNNPYNGRSQLVHL